MAGKASNACAMISCSKSASLNCVVLQVLVWRHLPLHSIRHTSGNTESEPWGKVLWSFFIKTLMGFSLLIALLFLFIKNNNLFGKKKKRKEKERKKEKKNSKDNSTIFIFWSLKFIISSKRVYYGTMINHSCMSI